MRLFAKIAYDGTDFAGWQRQLNAQTVQAILEDSLSILHGGIKITIAGCGRTDAGVHASDYILHFDLPELKYDMSLFQYKWDKILPKTISIKKIYTVSPDFHSRFDAISRSYKYFLHTHKNPFKGRYSTYYTMAKGIDIDILNEVGNLIKTHSDFATFCKSNTDVKTTLCNITESKWTISTDGRSIEYSIKANRFLRGMVRLIVGTSINVAVGKLKIQDLEDHMLAGTKPQFLHSAPAQGLFLKEIKYPDEIQMLLI